MVMKLHIMLKQTQGKDHGEPAIQRNRNNEQKCMQAFCGIYFGHRNILDRNSLDALSFSLTYVLSRETGESLYNKAESWI